MTLLWGAVAGADTYEVQEWNWDGIVSGWYGSRLVLDADGAATNALSFLYNFGEIDLPRCGRTTPTPLTTLEVTGRVGLRMEWRVRGRFNRSRDAGPWSPSSNTLRLPDGSGVQLADSCCTAGTWDASNASEAQRCVACATGRRSGHGATSCEVCPTGTYAPAGRAVCTGCPVGSPDHDANASTPCVACAAGRAHPEARANTSCTSCESGTYAWGRAMPACLACSSGEYSSAGAIDCTRCAAGTTDDDFNASTPCVACTVGRAGGNGAAPCVTCPSGWYGPEPGAASCPRCSAGQYSARNATSCEACVAGHTDHDENSSTVCEICEPGYFSVDEQAGSCTVCGAGLYSNVSGTNNTCSRCPAGQYANGFPRFGCENCTLGWADADYTAATPCEICEAGTYSDTLRFIGPCTECADGEWSDEGTTECWFDDDPFRHYSTMDFIMEYALIPGGVILGVVFSCVCLKKTCPYVIQILLRVVMVLQFTPVLGQFVTDVLPGAGTWGCAAKRAAVRLETAAQRA